MISNPEWIKARKLLFQQVRDQVQVLLGPNSSALDSYANQYEKEFQGRWRHSSLREMHAQILSKRLIYGADFHAFAQSQRTHIRILRTLPKNRSVTLCMECLEPKHDLEVERFLSGKITEKTFLKRVQWNEFWGFPWEHYKPFFSLARKMGFNVKGINKSLNPKRSYRLVEKDNFAAKLIVSFAKENPETLLYVIFGEWHLSLKHIPARVEKLSADLAKESLILYQNNEKLYFQLARQGMENQIHIMRGPKNKWCVLGAPPWVQWQSYLMFLQQTMDMELDEDEFEETDYTDYLHSQLQFICGDLGLAKMKFDDLDVFTSHDSEVWNKLSPKIPRNLRKMALYHIRNDKSFLLPKSGVFYLSRSSVNHMAELAGEYLQAKMSGRKSVLWTFPENFQEKIWVEALGFLASKLVNHKRKAENLANLKAQLAVTQSNERGREALLLALDQRLCEILWLSGHRDSDRKFTPKSKEAYIDAAEILGSMLGDKLYIAYRGNRFSKSDLQDIFKIKTRSKNFKSHYFKVLGQLEDIVHPDTLGGVIYG